MDMELAMWNIIRQLILLLLFQGEFLYIDFCILLNKVE